MASFNLMDEKVFKLFVYSRKDGKVVVKGRDALVVEARHDMKTGETQLFIEVR